ncbi:monofunctional biosynthetic peptidoglycan transglycosylase [Rubrivirga litoralis]|uniref:Biosynthetic peptidoglycan transglycosylase n=1 Tax=Rubrivirga litoralis TaxID=3075598 RepID=A0ABU3BMW6_9BACT|nr:monofunctional biosynthetic peptidoglycan transglycosylase [Rubrivirga sp. F394]MDT0630645.1 monofunctional biosynthetic peptidoglycan transglycosylase [Rubrivirga sp. F394]
MRAVVAVVGGYLVACTLLLVAYRWVEPPATTVQVQRLVEAAVAGEPYELRYHPVPQSGQDDDLRHAVVASEDARFYTHGGFDWDELRAAREAAERTGRPMRGASTLTQQLVKNLFLTTHRSVVRKAFEVPLTLLAELILPKDRILTLYLDVAEWGPGVFGAEAAARHHYGTSADALTREQSARLAAVLPAPLARRPQDMGRTSSRILTRMRQMGW